MTLYTADLHLGHANILTLSAARDARFETVEQMDAALIERWNETVGPDDTVWVPGDVDMHGKPTSRRQDRRPARHEGPRRGQP